uniref:Uncharacterized protein n=1 Tax=viral metagenome TaxID=1070528 RepID=A0A6M3IKU5_9ZZZZ
MINKNFVIKNKYFETEKDLIPHLFCNEVYEILEDIDMYDILVIAGIFKSKGDARKNWKRTKKEISKGYSEYKDIGKLHNQIFIFNPIKT